MKLAEILNLIIVPGKAKSGFLGGKAPDEHLKYARAAWNGHAFVQWFDLGASDFTGYRIDCNEINSAYWPSFDDLMADDWELVTRLPEPKPDLAHIVETASIKAMAPRADHTCLCSHPESKHSHTGSCRKCECTHFEAP